METTDDTACDIQIKVSGINVSVQYSYKMYTKTDTVLFIPSGKDISFYISGNGSGTYTIQRFS